MACSAASSVEELWDSIADAADEEEDVVVSGSAPGMMQQKETTSTAHGGQDARAPNSRSLSSCPTKQWAICCVLDEADVDAIVECINDAFMCVVDSSFLSFMTVANNRKDLSPRWACAGRTCRIVARPSVPARRRSSMCCALHWQDRFFAVSRLLPVTQRARWLGLWSTTSRSADCVCVKCTTIHTLHGRALII
eukprot:SAG11_NODE_8533_length_1004_cov_1.901657_2_plen_194_part_00